MAERGELRSRQIADELGVSWPAVSQHLRVLTAAQFLVERRVAQSRLYDLAPQGFDDLDAYLARFWKARLARLKSVVESALPRETQQ